MTTTDFTPSTTQLQTPVFVTLDPREAVRAAQHAGTLAYNEAQAAGCGLEECADSYHAAFVDTARELGQPIPCPCDYCTTGGTPLVTK